MASPVEHHPFVGERSELEEDLIVSVGVLQNGSRVNKWRLGLAATVLCLVVATAGILLHKLSTSATYALLTHVEEEVQMVDDEAHAAEMRALAPKGYCQIYAVPINFWDKYTKYKKTEPSLEKSAMRKYFKEWGSEDGKQPHVTITRDQKFTGGDSKDACRMAAQDAMKEFWKSREKGERFSLDSKKLKGGYSPSKKANKLKMYSGGGHKLLDALERFFRDKEEWPKTDMPLHATHVSGKGSPSYKAALEEHDWRVVANFKISGGDREWLWLGNVGKL